MRLRHGKEKVRSSRAARNRGPNIFDFLERRNIPYHVSAPAKNRAAKPARPDEATSKPKKLTLWRSFTGPRSTGSLHNVGNQSALVAKKLREYEQWIQDLLATAGDHYAEIRLYVFSDHGMANCDELLDLKSKIEPLPLRFGKDYAVVYDSTMARFWFFLTSAPESRSPPRSTRFRKSRVLP